MDGRALQAESCDRQKLVLLYCIRPICPRPAHCKAPVGREHGRSIPFSDMAQPMIDWNDGANASRSTGTLRII